MSQDYWTPTNDIFEYRLMIHKLSSPKCFVHHLHNYEYSFLWQSSDDTYSISTPQYSFDKTCAINFNKTKLKLRLNEFLSNNDEDNEENYNKTKLILCEKQINSNDNDNDKIKHLDEITLSTNYFIVNKRQLTNITFNKIIENDVRIELKLNVTLLSKQIGNEELVVKWLNNINNVSGGGYSSSGYTSDNKRRRSGLCTNSVSMFYQKSKEIEEKKKEENKIFDQQMVTNMNEIGNKLMISMEELKNLKLQIKNLQTVLVEKNIEINGLKNINCENNDTIKKLTYENNKLKSFENSYRETLNENKILIQTMKYQLQCRYGKYNELLNVMKINEKNKLKKYIGQLIHDNDDLEYEIKRIADSWKSTSNLMEDYTNKKIKKYKKLKKLYKKSLNENKNLKNKLIKNGTAKQNIKNESESEYQSKSEDIDDIINETDGGTEEDINVLWNDNDYVDNHIDSDTAL
eukprot:48979_1